MQVVTMGTQLQLLVFGFLFAVRVLSVSAMESEDGFSVCQYDDEAVATIVEFQRVSDFLIAVAYFSIPLELIYFITCSNVPFKWVLLEFIAFIVLCGLTHLLNGLSYSDHHHGSFQLLMALTVAKILTALVSCATAITLLTLFPILFKIKVRELFLRQNVLELGQEVGIMKKQKEVSWHVRMLTQEIRKSLDKHTILYTTLVELSKTLDLQNCAVWMPSDDRKTMNLTHQLSSCSSVECCKSLPVNDVDVLEIIRNKGVRFLNQGSYIGESSSGGDGEVGPVAAIRMPVLHGSNFKGGTPELVETCYAILVLVLRSGSDGVWGFSEMEIVEVVADQVAVAMSHASVLEESRLMREKLEEQNRVLQKAKENALMASHTRNSFQKVMGNGMRRPMHSILGLLSVFENHHTLRAEQRMVVDAIIKTGTVVSNLINDAMEISDKDDGRTPLEIMPFRMYPMIKEASCLIKCLCIYKGFVFSTDISNLLPNYAIGDEKRTFQVLLHMIGHLLDISDVKASVVFRVGPENGIHDKKDEVSDVWKPIRSDENMNIRFEIEMRYEGSLADFRTTSKHNNNEFKEGLSYRMCKNLVQMLQGNIWLSSDSKCHTRTTSLVLRFLKQSSMRRQMLEHRKAYKEQSDSGFSFKGLQVVVVDDDDVNRIVTRKLLEKLGCQVTAVSSGFHCLSALVPSTNYQVVILDLHMPEMDGYEVAMRIRKFRSQNWPLIIALTASMEEHVWDRCLQAGMNGLMKKPILLQGMADELRRVLQRYSHGL